MRGSRVRSRCRQIPAKGNAPMKNRGAYLGLLGPALWASVVLLTLGTVYPAKAADDPVKAEAQRLAAELRQSQEQLAVLQAENKKLRAELKDEQLKNAI